jgi:hypothetical protein
MRNLKKRGRCDSCGDIADLYEYNKSMTCGQCLGMDRRGVSRESILRKNSKNDGELRRSRKKRW